MQNDYNERVDVSAKWGAGVSLPDYPLEGCQSPRVISTSVAIAAAEALYRNNSIPGCEDTELAQRPSSPRCSISLRGCRARMSTRQTQQSRLQSYQLLVSLQAAMISLRKWTVYILKFDR